MVFVRTSGSIKLSSMMSQSYFTIKVAHVYKKITLVSTLVQEIWVLFRIFRHERAVFTFTIQLQNKISLA